mmetsp:Transcript_30589/g.81161  ORF Transcript_30589/g.81161 Transcript_30589/m.81161 type:complete len:173 (+) Transcript_30589:346-864(+)
MMSSWSSFDAFVRLSCMRRSDWAERLRDILEDAEAGLREPSDSGLPGSGDRLHPHIIPERGDGSPSSDWPFSSASRGSSPLHEIRFAQGPCSRGSVFTRRELRRFGEGRPGSEETSRDAAARQLGGIDEAPSLPGATAAGHRCLEAMSGESASPVDATLISTALPIVPLTPA